MLYEPLVWAVGSIALYAVVTNAAWVLLVEPRAASTWHRVRTWSSDPRIIAVGRGAYLLGVPVVALALRVVRPEQVGLVMPSSVVGVAVGLAVVVATLVVIVAAEAQMARAHGLPWRLELRRPGIEQLGSLALGALLLEAHWALFRAGGLSVASRNWTLAVYLGLALLAVEAWSNPALRLAHRDPSGVSGQARTAAVAVMSGTVFLASGSSILSLIGHLLVGTAILALWPRETHSPEREGATRDTPSVEPTVV